jgi:hypothetical protein
MAMHQFWQKIIWGPFITSPLRTNFDPRDEVVPQGWILSPWGRWSYPLGLKFSVYSSTLLNSIECSPLGVNEGVNISPSEQISPLGARGEVKNGPLVTHRTTWKMLASTNAIVGWFFATPPQASTVSQSGCRYETFLLGSKIDIFDIFWHFFITKNSRESRN